MCLECVGGDVSFRFKVSSSKFECGCEYELGLIAVRPLKAVGWLISILITDHLIINFKGKDKKFKS